MHTPAIFINATLLMQPTLSWYRYKCYLHFINEGFCDTQVFSRDHWKESCMIKFAPIYFCSHSLTFLLFLMFFKISIETQNVRKNKNNKSKSQPTNQSNKQTNKHPKESLRKVLVNFQWLSPGLLLALLTRHLHLEMKLALLWMS